MKLLLTSIAQRRSDPSVHTLRVVVQTQELDRVREEIARNGHAHVYLRTTDPTAHDSDSEHVESAR